MAANAGTPVIGKRKHHRQRVMSEINVTPMVDVMLVLLIIFMVTAPLLTAGVPVDLPDSKAAALEQDQEPVAISIDPSGRVFIDDAPVPDAALAERLRQIAARPGQEGVPRIYLRADRSLDYGRVMQVMGEINRAGLRRMALVGNAAAEERR